MALNKNIVVRNLITQLSIALALKLQLYGLLFLGKSHEMQASNFAIATLATQRNNRFGKFRKAKLRRLSRKGRSSWFIPFRTDQWWWGNILNVELPRETWKNFRMSRPEFEELFEMLWPSISSDLHLPIGP